MSSVPPEFTRSAVTTLRVVWIEIGLSVSEINSSEVTTLRVVWIEISDKGERKRDLTGHHLAGGVD